MKDVTVPETVVVTTDDVNVSSLPVVIERADVGVIVGKSGAVEDVLVLPLAEPEDV